MLDNRNTLEGREGLHEYIECKYIAAVFLGKKNLKDCP